MEIDNSTGTVSLDQLSLLKDASTCDPEESLFRRHVYLLSHIQRTLARQDQREQATPNRPPRANASQMNNTNKDAENKDKSEMVFGPNIGLLSSGPAWTQKKEKKVLTDELTPDVVRGWVEKSKNSNQPTTTLQALVNLKRPTLRLSPLAPPNESADEASDPQHQHHHGLEFEYDCDAPKCGIYVHVLLPPEHPEANNASYTPGMTNVLVYESVVEGGFGKTLRISDNAILELGRYDLDQVQAVEGSSSDDTPGADTSHPNSGSTDIVTQHETTADGSSNANHRHRRRFTNFHFRRRTHMPNRSVAGPALAVMDAEPPTEADASSNAEEGVKPKKDAKDDKEGVRVTIRLAALDDQAAELSSPNEQVTYLHVVRFGAKPVAAESEQSVEDTRPWVVKVVKREATIGPHTFQLHEIFGLSTKSHTDHAHAPTAPLPTDASAVHTYPPAATTSPIVPAPEHDDDPSSECLLCLSSPREVVLLPCRHLVACKECALNMVEFGAGGTITHTEEPTTATHATTEDNANETTNADAANNTAEAPPPEPVVVTPAPTRRKRKAKGWFCPVCRQPYTSLLRITTSPPPPQPPKAEESSPDENANPLSSAATTPGEAPATRPGFFTRSSFLRSFPRSPPMGDVENQIRPVRA
ncbi:hypothetical protein ONZ45_g18021 [Pleurotus djamor]|nr:hypothetical protein ONZ45_g18021 [Pleurotus djamor]